MHVDGKFLLTIHMTTWFSIIQVNEVTLLLNSIGRGDAAEEQLSTIIYEELRKMAALYRKS